MSERSKTTEPAPSPVSPGLAEAEALLSEAAARNPGFGWVEHSRFVSDAAGRIAAASGLDEPTARVFGLLHDIGRRAGYTHNRHMSTATATCSNRVIRPRRASA